MPDLLPPRWIVPANSADLLTLKLMEFASAPELWSEMSARNQAAARGFERSVLQPQRKQFYEAVRDYASVHPFEQELPNAA
jgi:hypothetical protein